MIILSQDKKVMINYNNSVALEVQHDDVTNNGYVIQALFYEYSFTCGEYATEERAKEILEEIVTLFKNEEILHITKSALNNLDEIAEPKYILKPVCRAKVYYMPKE